jgi:pimeloyl-ACP methyl ester carboxylesterase
MARLVRPDGAEIHWEETGEGDLVALLSLSYQYPDLLDPFVAELARDHRVIRLDQRGTGRSSRGGPYDMNTTVADVEAVVEAAGGGATAFALGDGARTAVRLAAGRPDLVTTVVMSGDQPLGPAAPGRSEGLADSPAVLDALIALMESDYRAGLRTMFKSGGPDEPDELMRERLDRTAEHSPQECTVERLRAWIRDDSTEQGKALGDRLWILHYGSNPWFEGGLEHSRRALPEAHFVEVSEGPVSEPAENADELRRIVAAARSAA